MKIQPDLHEAWNNRGIALGELGRYEEEIASYDRALKIQPDAPDAFVNKAITYALQNKIDLTLENLEQVIKLNPEYQELVKTIPAFDAIREDERFKALIK